MSMPMYTPPYTPDSFIPVLCSSPGRKISGDILLLEATTLFRAAEPDEAWRITDRILSASERPPAAVVNKAHYLRGLISDRRGDTAQLGREFKALEKSAGPDVTADREELAGRLAMAEGHWVAAIEAFDRTAGLLYAATGDGAPLQRELAAALAVLWGGRFHRGVL